MAVWECDVSKKFQTSVSKNVVWEAFPEVISEAMEHMCMNPIEGTCLIYMFDPMEEVCHIITDADVHLAALAHYLYEVDILFRTQKNLRTGCIRDIRRVVIT